MKKKIKFCCLILLITACLITISACGATEELIFTAQSDYYIVSSLGKTKDKKIFIPSTYNDKPVKEIYNYVFSGMQKITRVYIPDSVIKIGKGAFNGCSGLKSMEIPDSVTLIGDFAFQECSGLKSIKISKNVTSIGNQTFYDCSGITNIEIPAKVTTIGDFAFSYCSRIKNIEIPANVISIGNSAFAYCNSLEVITANKNNTKYHSVGNCLIETDSKTLVLGCKNSVIPTDGSVTSIGTAAFKGCTGLTSIEIPENVTSIGDSAFAYCNGIKNIEIPKNVTSVGDSAFAYCNALEVITANESNTKFHSVGNCLIETDSKKMVLGCKNSVIPTDGSVTNIGSFAFNGCSDLTSFEIPDIITSIGKGAFIDCQKLTSITIPFVGARKDQWKNTHFSFIFGGISSNYNSCVPESLNTVIIEEGAKSIDEDAFNGCKLTSITIPDSVTMIGKDAFKETIWYNNQPNGPVYAGKVLYKYKGKIDQFTSIEIKAGTRGIAPEIFLNCINLSDVTIPDSVERIGENAFDGTAWYNNQPNGPVYAGKVLYKYKGKTDENTSLEIKAGTLDIASGAFLDSNIASITIPNSVINIGSFAFEFCYKLTSITIPDSVKSIGKEAFGYSNLRTIIYEGTKSMWKAIEKGDNWCISTYLNTITCTDGTLTITEL